MDNVEKAVDLLGEKPPIKDAVKFLNKYGKDEEFRIFLSLLFQKLADVDEKVFDLVRKETGDDVGNAFADVYDKCYFKIDKGNLDSAINNDGDLDGMIDSLKKALKGSKIED